MNIININISDYKNYSEAFSTIEIEIKPAPNKYGKFINFEKKDEKYYHIYFNNEQSENMQLISVTLLLLKLLRFNSFNEEQSQNILLISITLLVLKLSRFNSFNEEHP